MKTPLLVEPGQSLRPAVRRAAPGSESCALALGTAAATGTKRARAGRLVLAGSAAAAAADTPHDSGTVGWDGGVGRWWDGGRYAQLLDLVGRLCLHERQGLGELLNLLPHRPQLGLQLRGPGLGSCRLGPGSCRLGPGFNQPTIHRLGVGFHRLDVGLCRVGELGRGGLLEPGVFLDQRVTPLPQRFELALLRLRPRPGERSLR